MVYDLISEFDNVLQTLPKNHQARLLIQLLDEAMCREATFIDRHPSSLFQCLWNTGWWYDCPEALDHYAVPRGVAPTSFPWMRSGSKLYKLLEHWRWNIRPQGASRPWIRDCRPPSTPLGTGVIHVLRGHTGPVRSIAANVRTRRLATYSEGYGPWNNGPTSATQLRIWDLYTGESRVIVSSDEAYPVTFSSDGRLLIGRKGEFVHIHAADSFELLRTLGPHGTDIIATALTNDGKVLYAAGANVTKWDMVTGQPKRQFGGSIGPISRIVILPAEHRVVTGHLNGRIAVWNSETHSPPLELTGHSPAIVDLKINVAESKLYSAAIDGTVLQWNLRSLAQERTIDLSQAIVNNFKGLDAITLSNRCRSAIIGSSCVNLADGATIAALPGQRPLVGGVSYLSERQIAVSCQDHSVMIVDLNRITPSGVRRDRALFRRPQFVGNSRRLLVLNGNQEEIVDAETGRMEFSPSEPATCVCMSPDRKTIAETGAGILRLRDSNSLTLLTEKRLTDESIRSMQFSPSGDVLVAISRNQIVRFHIGQNWGFPRMLNEDLWPTISVSSGGRRAVLNNHDGLFRIYDFDWCSLIKKWPIFATSNIEFLGDDSRIILGVSKDFDLHILEIPSGRELGLLSGHRGRISEVAVSTDCQRAASHSADGTTRIWKLDTCECEATYHAQINPGELVRPELFPFRVSTSDGESVIEFVEQNQVVGWHPTMLLGMTAQPNGSLWVAGNGGLDAVVLEQPESPSSQQWYYSVNHKTISGPVHPSKLLWDIRMGRLPPTALISMDRKKWHRATSVQGAEWPSETAGIGEN